MPLAFLIVNLLHRRLLIDWLLPLVLQTVFSPCAGLLVRADRKQLT